MSNAEGSWSILLLYLDFRGSWAIKGGVLDLWDETHVDTGLPVL
jgi:hypothetical protein